MVKGLSDIIGDTTDILTGGANSAARDNAKAARKAYEGVELPSIEDMRIQLEQLVQQGLYTPEEAQALLVEHSSFEDISTDPRLRDAQLAALRQLQDVGENGMTLQDRADLNRIANEESARERGSREALLQNAQARGIGGSGLELASQMIASQEATGRQAQRDMDIAAQAQARALQAMLASGELSGSIRSQDFAEQERVAQARDALAQFNNQNMQKASWMNTEARNQAQQSNLAEQQRIADQNVANRNAATAHNAGLAQANFNNQITKAGGTASSNLGSAGILNNQAEQAMKVVGAGAQAAAAASDRSLKKDIAEFDADEFLSSITGYKYKYKNPEKHGDGEQVGVMAQDLEKGAPQMVVTGEDGKKYVDYQKAGGPIFASLAALNKRLKKLEGEE